MNCKAYTGRARNITAGGLMFLLTPCLGAEPDIDVSDLLAAQQNLLGGVSSLEYTALQGKVTDGSYVKLTWRESGMKYWYRYINTGNGGADMDMTVSYDGERAYKRFNAGERIAVRSVPFSNLNKFINGSRSPLLVFDFLRSPGGSGTIASLVSAENIADLLERTETVPDSPGKVNGFEVVTARIKNGFDRFTEESVDYVVFFCPAIGFFPVGWEKYRGDGSFKVGFYVKKFRTLTSEGDPQKSFTYPSLAAYSSVPLEQMAGDNTGEEVSFPDISIDKIDDSEFSLDVAAVDLIEDLDTNTVITIPK